MPGAYEYIFTDPYKWAGLPRKQRKKNKTLRKRVKASRRKNRGDR